MKSGEDKHPPGISPDGKVILFAREGKSTHDDVWAVSPGGDPRVLVATDGSDNDASFSPDGRWIVYTSNVSGRDEAYIRPFPDGRSIQVSTEGGSGAEFSRDGSKLYFVSPERKVMQAALNIQGVAAHPGRPEPLFTLPLNTTWWTLARNSDRFLVCTRSEAPSAMNYVSNYK